MPRTIEATDAFPLKWPQGTPRNYSPKASAFRNRSWEAGIKEVRAELGRLGATDVTISMNIRMKSEATPYAGQVHPKDRGIAVYFKLKGEFRCLPCDKFATMGDNFHAIALTIEAMRALDRYGVGKSQQSFDGFKALPAVASSESEDWTAVLQIPANASESTIREAHIRQVRQVHSEGGDTSSAIARLNVARDAAIKERAGQR